MGGHKCVVQWKGSCWNSQQCFGVGMCIWNAQGDFLKALTKWLGESGLSVVQIELDCKLVVEGIMDSSKNQYIRAFSNL